MPHGSPPPPPGPLCGDRATDGRCSRRRARRIPARSDRKRPSNRRFHRFPHASLHAPARKRGETTEIPEKISSTDGPYPARASPTVFARRVSGSPRTIFPVSLSARARKPGEMTEIPEKISPTDGPYPARASPTVFARRVSGHFTRPFTRHFTRLTREV